MKKPILINGVVSDKYFGLSMKFLAPPHAGVLVLIVANVIEFILCVHAGGNASIPIDVLVSNGALVSSTLTGHAYWRLVAYGFLHANPTHLLMNMVGLAIVAPHLERRLGTSYFLLVYFSALVGAALVSIFAHHEAFITVGASGAIYGILAALFALWVLGETELPASFFLINFALNFAFSARSSGIDWMAHFGGFVTGILACALLDAVEKFNRLWLRCKFPEFVKLNLFLLAGAMGSSFYFARFGLFVGVDARIILACWLVACLCLVKIIDLLLSVTRGLAAVVICLAILDAALACSLGRLLLPGFEIQCLEPRMIDQFSVEYLQHVLCVSPDNLSIILSIMMGVFVLAAFWPQLLRGLKDTGFVAPTFVAERRRRSGI
jgi:rhomboid protease GluP